MGVCGAVSDLDDARCPAARLRPARGLQRLALDRPRRSPVAHVADQLPAVGSGLSTDTPLAGGRRIRDDGPRPARTVALGGGPQGPADGGHLRQRYAAIDAREWPSRRL